LRLEGHLRDARIVRHVGNPVYLGSVCRHRLIEAMHAIDGDHDDYDKDDRNRGRQRQEASPYDGDRLAGVNLHGSSRPIVARRRIQPLSAATA
jgi:hypothetical protein